MTELREIIARATIRRLLDQYLLESAPIERWWFWIWAVTHPFAWGKMVGRLEVMKALSDDMRAMIEAAEAGK